MKIKHFLMAMLCVGFAVASCDLLDLDNEPDEEEGTENNEEHPADKPSDDPNDFISLLWKQFNDEVDGKPYQNYWFEADGEDLGEEELGHTYFYPGYEVIYIRTGEDFKTLTIKFTTNYTTIV